MATTSTVTNPYKYTITEDIEITPIFSPKDFTHTYDVFFEQYIKNRGTITKTYDTYTIDIPETGYYRVTTEVRGGQTGNGYDGDKWQYCKFHLIIDGTNIVSKTYRRSQGFGWKTVYDADQYLTAGKHTIKLNVTASGSSKDTHWTRVYEWKNNIAIVI